MDARTKTVVVTAPTNIAIVKYWGKRCQKFNLPLNSSLSATLSQDHLKTTTTIETSPSLEEDEVWLNGVKQDVQANKRLLVCLSEFKLNKEIVKCQKEAEDIAEKENAIRRCGRKQAISCGDSSANDVVFYSQKVRIHSENNFPTAAGLASSASGYAALVFGLGALFGIKGDLTTIARQGSGSACRSLHGGFVEWRKGDREDGEDSDGVQVVPENHWQELRIFVLVVNDTRKKVGSTEGMQSTVRTSDLLKHRVENVVDRNMDLAKEAIMKKDFSSLAAVTMKESNQLHAVCLDTYPPLHYLNDVSYAIIDLVHAYNKAVAALRAAYTFDAGPNSCIFTTEEYAGEISWLITHFFPACKTSEGGFLRGLDVQSKQPSDEVLNMMNDVVCEGSFVKYVICTTLGTGPLVVSV